VAPPGERYGGPADENCGANPHLVTVTTNPGGVVNKSVEKNPNTQTFTFKTTGNPA
jgi:hypothetical protein